MMTNPTKPYQLVWTKTALKQLTQIGEHIAQDNPHRAQTFMQELRSTLEQLILFPHIGRVGRVFGTRELVLHTNYTAIYRVQALQVQILRVHHNAMQWQ